jgi:tetratricopeptide (TPR) repeat protein
LLREKEPYHYAWEELDRQHYRLALLGRLNRENALAIAKRHRMFSQQARLTPRSPDGKLSINLGIFREEQEYRNGVADAIITVNQPRIEADPELLRQWIHHRKAELVFSHLALGADPDLFLLGYTDDPSAKAKLKGLVQLARSLVVLGGEDGHLLAIQIEKMWRQLLAKSVCSYSTAKEAAELQFIKNSHLETLSDIAMLCLNWKPNARHSEIVNELIEFLNAEIVFFDASLLFTSDKKQDENESLSVKMFRSIVAYILNWEHAKKRLSDQEQSKLTNDLSARILLSLALATYEEFHARPKEAAMNALNVLERARQIARDNPEIEYFAARFYFIGDFYEESRKAISRFYQINKNPTSDYVKEIEEIQKALNQVEKSSERKYIKASTDFYPSGVMSSEKRLEELKQELERFPSSIQAYENIVHLLAMEGRFQAALEWTERAIGHCLSRAGQLKARMLNLETLALQTLGKHYNNEIKLFLTGVQSPLSEALSSECEAKPSIYSLHYLRGVCLLAGGELEPARQAFEKSLKTCNKQIHFSVLRPLVGNVEQALYEMTKQTIEQALKDKLYHQALEALAKTMNRLKEPALCLFDLARIQMASLLTNMQFDIELPQIPTITVAAPWNDRLSSAIGCSDALERARSLATLAAEVHPPSQAQAEALLLQIDQVKKQKEIAAALSRSSKLLQNGLLDEALKALESLGQAGNNLPRVLRQRAMLLLKLERFSQAEEIIDNLAKFEDPLAKDFVERYPDLKFWQQINIAQRLLRRGNVEAANEILSTVKPGDEKQKLEASYCRAFALSIQGYRCLADGARVQAMNFFNEAVDQLESEIASAREYGQQRLLELYEKLNNDLNKTQGN